MLTFLLVGFCIGILLSLEVVRRQEMRHAKKQAQLVRLLWLQAQRLKPVR